MVRGEGCGHRCRLHAKITGHEHGVYSPDGSFRRICKSRPVAVRPTVAEPASQRLDLRRVGSRIEIAHENCRRIRIADEGKHVPNLLLTHPGIRAIVEVRVENADYHAADVDPGFEKAGHQRWNWMLVLRGESADLVVDRARYRIFAQDSDSEFAP